MGTGAEVTYKALLVGSTRRACSVADCGGGSTAGDWVLAPDTYYVRSDGELLFVTTAASLPPSDFDNVFTDPINFWSGFNPAGDWTNASTNTCDGWTSNDMVDTGLVGWTASEGSLFVVGGDFTCEISTRLVCVEQ